MESLKAITSAAVSASNIVWRTTEVSLVPSSLPSTIQSKIVYGLHVVGLVPVLPVHILKQNDIQEFKQIPRHVIET